MQQNRDSDNNVYGLNKDAVNAGESEPDKESLAEEEKQELVSPEIQYNVPSASQTPYSHYHRQKQIVHYMPSQHQGPDENQTNIPAAIPLILGIISPIAAIISYFGLPYLDTISTYIGLLGAFTGLLAVILGSIAKAQKGKIAVAGAILGIIGLACGTTSTALSCLLG